jgi:hypothetical protein
MSLACTHPVKYQKADGTVICRVCEEVLPQYAEKIGLASQHFPLTGLP